MSHYGPGTYAQGTDAKGGLGTKGKQLLKEIENLGMILDATHLCDESFYVLKKENGAAAAYAFRGDELFVRAKVFASNGEMAFCQPVFIKK